MKKRICFFTTGFAFNRLVRMKYYEKIFPKNIEIFLFTTDKYKGKEKENYQFQWDLKRTKIHVAEYNKKLPFTLRKFCNENKIERLYNLGYFPSGLLLLYASIFSNRDFIINRFAKLYNERKTIKDFIVLFFRILAFSMLIKPAKKITFVDYEDHLYYKKLSKFFFTSSNKIKFLPAPVDTDLFKPQDKSTARKKLNLHQDKNIILFVGRLSFEKGSTILLKLIKANPEIQFIAIGRIIDKKFIGFKSDNFTHIEKKSSEELLDYYNASDFFYNLQFYESSGLGITTEEALATGTPSLSCTKEGIKPSKALFLIPIDFNIANKTIKDFFKLSSKERENLSKLARDYAVKYYSYNSNKYNYINYYLN